MPHPEAPWHGGPPWWAEPSPRRRRLALWAPVVLSLVVQVTAAVAISRLQQLAPDSTALSIALAAAGPAALIGARRFPGPVVAAVAAVTAATMLLDLPTGPYLALGFAIGGAVIRGARLWAWLAVAGCWLAMLAAALLVRQGDWSPPRIVGITLFILAVLGVSEAIASRRQRAQEFRRTVAERRRTEAEAERVRIARELHDVLAHSLSQIAVEAGVGLHLIEKQPEKAAEALASIRRTSRTALDEVRSVLGVLRADDTAPLVPEPTLDRIAELAAPLATQGIAVDLRDELDHAAVPKPVQLALYRIVQEALTNVVRHGRGVSRVEVRLSTGHDRYVAEISDDGERPGDAEPGRGLTGMRERAELLGGSLTTEPGDRGFRVRAEVPR